MFPRRDSGRHRVGRSFAVLGIGVGLALGLAAAPASAGEPPVLKVARHKSGPYSDNIGFNLGAGQSKDYFLKARAVPGTGPQAGNLRQPFKTLVKTKYFKGDQNITQEVASVDGFDFILKDKAKRFRGVVKDTELSSAECFIVQLEGSSGNDGVTVAVNGGLCS